MAKDKQQQEDLTKRSAEEVFEEHLKLAIERDMEAELSRNNAEDIVLLTNFGVFHGHQGVREAAELLEKELPSFVTTKCVIFIGQVILRKPLLRMVLILIS